MERFLVICGLEQSVVVSGQEATPRAWIPATAGGSLPIMKGASKPKKGAKKQAQKSLKERRAEKKAAAEKKFSSGY